VFENVPASFGIIIPSSKRQKEVHEQIETTPGMIHFVILIIIIDIF